MLVQNSVYRNTYLTDGVNKDFYFSFPILEASQVLVQTSLLTDTGTVTTVGPGQYTVIGVGQTTGGHISFTTAPPSGSRLALTLNIPITQLYQYAELDSFPAKSHEDALAKLTLICQQLREQISRAVLISATSEGSTADLIASLYAARDSAAASADSAVAEAAAATLAATNAEQAATDAAQAAADAAANSSGLVTEVQNLSTMLVGAVFPLTCADGYVPNGCVPTSGGEYTRAQFPTLYDTYLVGGKLLTCTYAEWTAQVGLTGNCAKFALDTAAQKFKVPLLKDGDSITQASSVAELGKSVKAGLPDVQGTLPIRLSTVGLGAFSNTTTNTSGLYAGTFAGGDSGTSVIMPVIKASSSSPIYSNSTTVTDEQVRLRHFVVVASAQNNASVFDWSNYMAALAGKANVDLSNATGNAIGFYFYARDEKPSGTAGGSSSSATWHTRDLNTVVKTADWATLASNRITLQPGRYYIRATAPGYAAAGARVALYNVTAGTYFRSGRTEYSGTSYASNIHNSYEDEITLSVPSQIELRMYVTSGYGTYGLGQSMWLASIQEIYSELRIWKL